MIKFLLKQMNLHGNFIKTNHMQKIIYFRFMVFFIKKKLV